MLQNPSETVNAHYTAIIQKDLPDILNKYHATENTYVVLEGPRLTTIGYSKIAKGWTDFCASPITLTSINWTEGPLEGSTEKMAWIAGIIELNITINGKPLTNTFRASFVLINHSNKWLIQHEHVSVAHPNPYGVGDWLKA